ncbi:MAG TPA: CocE/NonD family hydrolase C-terminal non-catalytic domain-containing protein, partial [Planctomycetota bacterium]|nr:CocE/NonD family hydrolase C-terminal non-catalytic domain-containing protein [Planctomycetota bacterium]
ADHAHAEPLVPGTSVRRRLALNDTAHAFAPGNRVRLALSTAYWPILWPAPDGATLTLSTAACRLELPRRAPRPEDALLRPFEPPEAAPPDDVEDVHEGGVRRERCVDPATGEVTTTTWIDLEPDGGPSRTRWPSLGLESGHAIVERFSICPDDPLSARAEVRHTLVLARAAGEVRVETLLELTADAERFHLRGHLRALEDSREVFERNFAADPLRVPRNRAESPTS